MNIHIVEKGDTVWKIANKYSVLPYEIIEANGLISPDRLVIGQSLLVLKPKIVHIVETGDTLFSIANKYEVDPINIIQNNPGVTIDATLIPTRRLVIAFEDEKKRTITTNGYAYTYVNKRLLEKTMPYLSRLTIFGYGFTQNGDLININDDWMIKLAYKYKTAPIMLLSSLTETGVFSGKRASYIFNNKVAQNALISKVIAKMQEKGYLGLDIDFEFIMPKDKQAYADFVQNFHNQLSAQGFSLNVDLAPKTSAQQEGLLYEAHDYANLGRISDTVFVMTYEWGYTYGPPMAVAPIDKVEEVINYAVSEIPPEKILMGIPNYGYDWLLPYVQGISQAVSIGNDYAAVLAARKNTEILFDEIAQSPYYTYYDRTKKEHIVWFEDVRSIKAKYDLLEKNNLKGSGYWNVMRAFVSNWMYVNALYFIEKLNI